MKQFWIIPAIILAILNFGEAQEVIETGGVGELVISSNVKNATIVFSGEATAYRTPAYIPDLPAGEYVLELVDTFGKRIQREIVVAPNSVETIKMNFDLCNLEINSNISADTIYINDVPVAEPISPERPALITRLAKGDYSLKIKENNYGLIIEDKVFLQDVVNAVTITAQFGSLEINSNEKKARIFLNGRSTGEISPATFTGLTTGIYDVLLVKGIKKARQTVQLMPNTNNRVEINFEKSHFWRYVAIGTGTVGAATLTYFLTRKDEEPDQPGLGSMPPPEN